MRFTVALKCLLCELLSMCLCFICLCVYVPCYSLFASVNPSLRRFSGGSQFVLLKRNSWFEVSIVWLLSMCLCFICLCVYVPCYSLFASVNPSLRRFSGGSQFVLLKRNSFSIWGLQLLWSVYCVSFCLCVCALYLYVSLCLCSSLSCKCRPITAQVLWWQPVRVAYAQQL